MSSRKGITLMEVMVVLAVLGLIALVLVPRLTWAGKGKLFDVLVNDIKNLAAAEEIYYAEHFTYTSKLADLDFSPSEEVTLTLSGASAEGWSVTATHFSLDRNLGCGLFYGRADTSTMEFLPSAPGEIYCKRR